MNPAVGVIKDNLMTKSSRAPLRTAILSLTGLLVGLAACQDESASMGPGGSGPGLQASTPNPMSMSGPLSPAPNQPGQAGNQPAAQPTPSQPNPNQPNPSQPNPNPMPSDPGSTVSGPTAAGSAGHAWCEAGGLKKPSLTGAHSLFVAGPNDVWYLLADPFFGSYNTEANDPDDDVYVHGRVPKIAHWNGSALCETNLHRLFGKDDRRRLAALFSIWGSGPDNIWISGNYGMLLHWDGRTWTVQPSPDGSALTQLLGNRADNMYAVGGGGLYHWNGQKWRWVELPGVASRFEEIWIDAKERVWARIRDAYKGCDIYRVDTDGSVKCTLNVQASVRFYLVKRIGGSGVAPWVIIQDYGKANLVYRFDETDDKWETFRLNTSDVYSVRAFADDDVWFGGAGLMIHFDGTDLTKYPVPAIGDHVDGWILDIQGTSSRDMWGIAGGVLGGEAGFRGNLDGFVRMN